MLALSTAGHRCAQVRVWRRDADRNRVSIAPMSYQLIPTTPDLDLDNPRILSTHDTLEEAQTAMRAYVETAVAVAITNPARHAWPFTVGAGILDTDNAEPYCIDLHAQVLPTPDCTPGGTAAGQL